jgi:hypothetical protein
MTSAKKGKQKTVSPAALTSSTSSTDFSLKEMTESNLHNKGFGLIRQSAKVGGEWKFKRFFVHAYSKVPTSK